MKPRNISETQRVRALSVGIKLVPESQVDTDINPILIPDHKVFRTSAGCRVETWTDSEGEHVVLGGVG